MPEMQKYGGTWKLFQKETQYQGELHFSEGDRFIALEILIPASEGNSIPTAPYIGKVPYICGTLFSGARVLLYDCSTGMEQNYVMSFTRQIIYAKYAFWGLSIDSLDDMKFSAAIINFEDVIAWSGLCKYEWNYCENESSSLSWIHKDSIEVKWNENLKLTFSPQQGKIGGDMFKKEICVYQHILFEFSYTRLTDWNAIMEDVLCIQYLIGLGVNHYVEIDKIKYIHPSIFHELPRENGASEKIAQPAELSIGTGKIEARKESHVYEYLFTLEELVHAGALQKWRDNYAALKPVLDLYFTAFSNNIGTPEMLFLNITQALETFHARFVTDDAKTYPDRVNKLLSSFCANSGNSEKWKTFLIDDLQRKSKNRILLRTRLVDLAFADGKLPFWPTNTLPVSYIQRVVDSRNYYTHYSTEKHDLAFTRGELRWVNGQLLALMEYHLLVFLGFETDQVRKKTVEKIGRICQARDIQNQPHDVKR